MASFFKQKNFIFLDNTIAGTDEERGFTKRHAAERASEICRDPTYDFPFGMELIKKIKFLKWPPISPTFEKHFLTKLPYFNKDEKPSI